MKPHTIYIIEIIPKIILGTIILLGVIHYFIKEYKKFFKSVIKTMDETVIINMYIIHFITTYYKSKLARFKLILQKTEKAIKNIHSSYSKEMQSKFDENFQL